MVPFFFFFVELKGDDFSEDRKVLTGLVEYRRVSGSEIRKVKMNLTKVSTFLPVTLYSVKESHSCLVCRKIRKRLRGITSNFMLLVYTWGNSFSLLLDSL